MGNPLLTREAQLRRLQTELNRGDFYAGHSEQLERVESVLRGLLMWLEDDEPRTIEFDDRR